MKKPKRSADKYWQGTKNFDQNQYNNDLQEYIIEIECEVEKYKKKYKKCIDVINRFDAGIIGMYDL